MKQIEKNTVKAENQLNKKEYVTFINRSGKGKRIMFVGNSITKHAAKEEIGWYGDWGMAASKEENDYVHIVIENIRKYCSDPAFCICQVVDWEREFRQGESTYNLYTAAKDFNADIIIARMIENCPRENFSETLFKKEYSKFIAYLNSSESAAVIITSSFWEHDGDKCLKEYAEENNYPFVYLGDLGEDESMKAFGKFGHEGVAQHPGDKGMKAIADRITFELKKMYFCRAV